LEVDPEGGQDATWTAEPVEKREKKEEKEEEKKETKKKEKNKSSQVVKLCAFASSVVTVICQAVMRPPGCSKCDNPFRNSDADMSMVT
jgi:hypothetical protein